MIEKVGTIKNPLTIIAIFAGIAEISGTAILPFISDENQSTYIWFLMIFPLLLISLFFLTLNFNHRVLYAPSDYKDEDNFVKSLQKASFIEKARKLEEELASIDTDGEDSASSPPQESSENSISYKSLVKRSTQASYMLAEELIFDKLSKEYPVEIQREVKLGSLGGRYIFDGLVKDKTGTTAIEVKFLRHGPIHRLKDSIYRIAESAKLLPDSDRKNFKILLAVATDQDKVNFERIRDQLDQIRKEFPFPIEVRFYNLADLEREYEISP